MYARTSVGPELRLLSRAQSGIISRQQALDSGLSRTAIGRLLRDGQFQRWDAGLYVVGATVPSWKGLVWGGLLLGGGRARAGGLTAARLDGLTDSDDLPIEVMVPHDVRVSAREWVRFAREQAGVRRASLAREPRRVRIEDSVLDLCARGSAGDVVMWTTAAVQRRLTTPGRLLTAMQSRARLGNRWVLQEILGSVVDGVHSNLEFRYVRDVERPHGLPPPIRQYRVPISGGYADGGYPDYGMLLELDGRGYHSGIREFRDRERDNRHALAGWTTVRFGTYEIYGDPCGVAWSFGGNLVDHGWRGSIRRCRRCRGRSFDAN